MHYRRSSTRLAHKLFSVPALVILLLMSVSLAHAQDEATTEATASVESQQPVAPSELPPTEAPTEVVAEETATNAPAPETPVTTEPVLAVAPESVVVPEAAASALVPAELPAEPALFPLFYDNFDGGLQYTWTLGAGWSLTPNETGQALQLVGSSSAVTFSHNTIYNVAIQARFFIANGIAGFSVRHGAEGGYRAAFDRLGNVTLYRGSDLVQSAALGGFEPDGWHALRLSAMEDVVRVAVDGIEAIAWRDGAPLAAGSLTIHGSGSDNLTLVDDFQLWIPDSVGSAPVPVAMAAQPVITAAPQPVVQEVTAQQSGPLTFVDSPRHRQVKVLTVAMFEVGALVGDTPGEAQQWIENEGLTQVLQIPGSYSPLYCNDRDHCLVITGQGFSNAATTLMALGFNQKVDLSKAYILIAGIAGVDPEDGTIGGAAWADWVVSGNLSHEIDAREMPANFDYPIFAQACYSNPFCAERRQVGTEVYQLNSALTDWAYALSQNVQLLDNANAQAYRANYPAHLPGSQPPSVMRCDVIAADTYWHGEMLSNWANWWVANWTGGHGNYCMTNQEDSATLTAIRRLQDAGLADYSRVMVLRTASNFDQQYPGQAAIQSLGTSSGGFIPSVVNAYRVGSVVTDHIIDNWNVWRNGVPAR